jgi:hypothetical protein
MIIEYCYILIARSFAIIFIDMCQTVSAATCEPELGIFFILCPPEVDIRLASLLLTDHRRVIETYNLAIMSLNALYLLIGRI